MRILFVCMPWHGLHIPSLGLSTLAPLGRASRYVERLDIRYANIEWAEHLRTVSEGRLDSEQYRIVAEGDQSAVGEWVFSGSLYGHVDPQRTRYHAAVAGTRVDLGTATEMYHLASSFVDALADDICGRYDVIGFTTMFVQNVASLALARAIKQRAPDTTVIFGGANCDDEQGAALHRNFAFVDYVVRGEAERAFVGLLDLLGGDPTMAVTDIPGLCWWDGGTSVANPMPQAGVNADEIPEPTYDEYFDAFARYEVCRHVRPRILLEGARGCWWGQKHHCTFCGLNDTIISFRAKPADRVLDELSRAVHRYRVLDAFFVDNIIDQRYLHELLPRVSELGWDLQVFFETKANQTYANLELMARAGVTQVQPGIESFSTPVLKLMRKGVTGWQNVRFLRDCRTVGVDPLWNILYGFPGETDVDYLSMVEQLPRLVHLRAPQGATRVELTRFSPFFTDPSLGMVNLGPSALYREIYELPDAELADLSYFFRSPDTGVGESLLAQLRGHVEVWLSRGPGPSLVAVGEDDDRLVLIDARNERTTVEHTLSPAAALVYRTLLKGREVGALTTMMERTPGAPPAARIIDLLDSWYTDGLVYRDGDTYVALATGLAYR